MADLDTGVRFIKGVGEQRAKSLNKLGIETLRDLVGYFPRAYEDRTEVRRISQLVPGETVCVLATVAADPRLSHIRKGLDLLRLRAVDESGSLSITFFNQSYVKDSLKLGETYAFYGKIGGSLIQPEMTNPVFEPESSFSVTRRIMPVYRLTAGLSQNLVARCVAQGLAACGDLLPDPLPAEIQQTYRLCQSRYAYENIHFPKSPEDLETARRRLIFEEFFVFACALAYMRRGRVKKQGIPIPAPDMTAFYEALPFRLTGAQNRAVADALRDMAADEPMSRLIQGDVGSGKTVVAAACCYAAARAGFQSAMMAPTEILAEQHCRTLTEMLEPLGLHVELLTGKMPAKTRREVLARLETGAADVVVGTHALISAGAVFDALGLVITDEQHRFGVAQRAALTAKGTSPHVLVMSATPIPRTLALMMYGELDISVIDELPPGRTPVETYAVDESMRARIYAFMRRLVGEGRQIYVVCPMVEENETGDDGLKSVSAYAKRLQEEIFSDLRVGFVHGKMKSKEKESVMRAFAAGELDILVATTVIEVGVDVPNAALMVVENADRFGLSQLHQLRGRVGRGKHQSYCVLFRGGGDVAKERLRVMCETTDGFKISEEDLKLRGPGDFFGNRQHGLPEMKIADLSLDIRLMQDAQAAAQELIAADPELARPEHRELQAHVQRMLTKSADTLN